MGIQIPLQFFCIQFIEKKKKTQFLFVFNRLRFIEKGNATLLKYLF
jgi:hypothetical protein